jgi:cytochrome-b5 reductase
MPGLLSSENINGVYIPVGLLIFGTYIVKKEWLPYAVAVAAVLAAFKLYGNRKIFLFEPEFRAETLKLLAEPKKILKPNEFQEFELKEKTILSHNTAMCVVWKTSWRALQLLTSL